MKKKILLTTVFAIIAFFAVAACTSKVDAATWTNNTNTMTITRKVTNVTNPVTNQFTYTITAASGNPAVTGLPETQGVNMQNVSPDGSNVATGTGTLNFTNVNFTQVGDYHYTVTENDSSDSTTYPVDTTNTYDVVVRVTNNPDNEGQFIATLIGQVTNSNNDPDKKSNMEFSKDPKMESLQVTKNVTGDMGNKNEYFKVQITVQGGNENTYAVSGADSGDISYKETTVQNPTSVTGSTPTIFYLKHGQTITIGKTDGNIEQIKIGTNCQVEEQEMSGTGYTVKYNGTEQASMSHSIVDGDNIVTIENNKQSETLTGIFMDYGPYVLLVVLAAVGLVIIRKNSIK